MNKYDCKFPDPKAITIQNLTDLNLEIKERIKDLKKSYDQGHHSVKTIKDGHCFGEAAIFEDRAYETTSRAVTNCHIGVIMKLDYMKSVNRIVERN